MYLALLFGSIVGWSWLLFNQIILTHYRGSALNACFIKQITGLPCPSCGSTRSAMSLLSGHFQEAIYYNPLGILLVVLLFTIPAWLLHDWILKTDSLYRNYKILEGVLQRKIVMGAAIVLICSNWIWNFMKGY